MRRNPNLPQSCTVSYRNLVPDPNPEIQSKIIKKMLMVIFTTKKLGTAQTDPNIALCYITLIFSFILVFSNCITLLSLSSAIVWSDRRPRRP